MNFGGQQSTREGEKFRGTLNSIAYGEVMAAAAKNIQKEMMDEEDANRNRREAHVDIDDLLDDPELERLHEERLAQLQREQEKRVQMKAKGHGTYDLIEEGDFLEAVTKTELVVVHFFHKEFERCKIVDKHMKILAQKYFDTKFVKLSAPEAPFFTQKLGVRVLPCLIIFRDGVTVDRITGFEELGCSDDFSTHVFERRLKQARALKKKQKTESDDDEDDEDWNRAGRSVYAGERPRLADEDSDFSESD